MTSGFDHAEGAGRRPLPAVTIVAHDVGPVGGMERQITRLAAGLLDAGHYVTIVARRCAMAGHPRLRVFRVPAPRKPFALYYPWFMLAARVVLSRAQRGVLHATGAIVLGRVDLSTVHFCHHAYQALPTTQQSVPKTLPRRLNAAVARVMSSAAERWCYQPKRCRQLVAVSSGVADEIGQFIPSATGLVTVIPNGVDRERFRPDPKARSAARGELSLDPHDLVALFVGGDWERKGLGLAIESLKDAAEWQLVVVGEGDRATHREMARAAGVSDRVVFAGRREDTERFYAAADVFLLPTAYEAFPLVALEAAASGLAMICTRVNGIEDLFGANRNGFLVDRSSSAIAARLRLLAEDPDLRVRLGLLAREATEQYDWQEVVRRYSGLYRELAQCPTHR